MTLKDRIKKLVGAPDEKAFNTTVSDAHNQYAAALTRQAEARADLDAAIAAGAASEALQAEAMAEGGTYDAAGSARAQDAIRAAETKLRVCDAAVITAARNIELAEAARHAFRIDTAKQAAAKSQRAIVSAAKELGQVVEANRAAIEHAHGLGIATISLDGPAAIAAWTSAAEHELAPRVAMPVDARRAVRFLKSASVEREHGIGSSSYVAGDVAGFSPSVAAKLVSLGLAAFYQESDNHAAAIAEAGRALDSEQAAKAPAPLMGLQIYGTRAGYLPQ